MIYRIVTNGSKYRVQWKCLWWWVTEMDYEWYFATACPLSFDSEIEAENFIEQTKYDEEVKKRKWRVVK